MDWFLYDRDLCSESVKNNCMIANPDKFQAIILSKYATDVNHKLRIYDNDLETTKSAKLLGVKIYYQIWFNEHISALCSKTAMQLNALYRLPRFMGKTEKNAITNNFIWFATCARKPKVPGSSPATIYAQRWALWSNRRANV